MKKQAIKEVIIDSTILSEQKAKPKPIRAYTLLAIFVIGSIFGTYWEQLLELVFNGHWITQRGVLYGPFNPVYGFGAAGFAYLLGSKDRPLPLTILFGALVGGLFEYILHDLEMFFTGTVSWNYADKFMDIPSIVTGGLTSGTTIPYMLFWGLLGALVVKGVLPLVEFLVNKIPKKALKIPAILLTVFLSFNMLLTGAALLRQSSRQSGNEPANPISRWLDNTYPDDVIYAAFPDKNK